MGFHDFPKGISVKLKVIARLKFELTYSKTTVQHFSYYDAEILS